MGQASIAVLYTEPRNRECNKTRTALRNKGVEFEEINVRKDSEALAFVTEELGHSVLPVVWVDHALHWSGHDPAKIERAADELG